MTQPSKPSKPGTEAAAARQALRDRIELLVRGGKTDEAIAITEAHVRVGSRDGEMLRYRALLEQRAGRMGLAIAFAERAEALETNASTLMLIAQGKTLQQIQATRPALDYETRLGSGDTFVRQIYDSLMAAK